MSEPLVLPALVPGGLFEADVAGLFEPAAPGPERVPFEALTTRARHVVRRWCRIDWPATPHPADFAKIAEREFLGLRNCGPVTRDELRRWLASHGLAVRVSNAKEER